MCLKRAATAVFLLAVMLGGQEVFATPIPVESVAKDASGITCAMSPGVLRLDVCSDAIIRVRYTTQNTMPVDKNMDFLVPEAWTAVAFTQTETDDAVTVTTSKVQVNVNKTTGAVTFLDAAGTPVLKEVSDGGKSLKAATINGESTYTCEQIFDSPADEGIYGLGSMHDGIINYHGRPQYLHQCNTHISIPMIISSKGYGILWANASKTYFNLPEQRINLSNGNGSFTTSGAGEYVFLAVDCPNQGDISLKVNGEMIGYLLNMWHALSMSGKITLGANATVPVSVSSTSGTALYGGLLQDKTKFTSRSGQTIDYYFFYGPSPDEVIAGYREATGMASMFSKGTYGFIQCRERYSSQTEILDNASQFRSKKIPVDIIVQDWNYWTGGWNSMVFDAGAYPNPQQMISTLHDQHFGYMISVWSKTNGGSAVDNALAPYRIQGTEFFDPYNPAARSVYWTNMNTRLFNLGVDAFWQDADEPEGVNLEDKKVNFGSGAIGGKDYANAYGMFVSKTVYEGWRSTNSTKRVCIKGRSAFAGTQRFGTFCWNGDINGNWDWYQRSVQAGLNFCMAGMPYWTTDIGGFFRPGSGQYTDAGFNELLTRWIQYGAFCPMFRIHGYQTTTEIWRYQQATQNAFMIYDNLRYRLLPYIYSLAGMVTQRGGTLMRGLVMDFRNDDKVLDIDDQFMFGPAFLVNPIMSAGATKRDVYLPTGTNWYDFWTGKTHGSGQTLSARAPRDTIPLYIRAGSIIPMGPYLQYVDEKKTDTIELRVYPGADGSFTMYEDEGDNYNYEKGDFATIPISYIDNPRNVIIGKRSGSFTGMDEKKVFNIVFAGEGRGTGVAPTTQPDTQLVYTGEQVSIVPVTGARIRNNGMCEKPVKATLRVAGNRVVLPSTLNQGLKRVSVFDCSGRLLRTAEIKRHTFDLRKDMRLPDGVYIVKVRDIR
ncbi:MAG: glycoside hydrolase family 31 protein [Chitinispirillaceae bacterium]|nr:glycoside hydrolase family 31 protein [Chitinispirillaceae bacterium]